MRITVEIQDRIKPLASEWERLAQDTGASPFLWPGWVNAWWHAFGKGRLQIFVAYQDSCLAGILPMQQNYGALISPTNTETPSFGFLAVNEAAVKQLSGTLISRKPRRIDLHLLHSADPSISLIQPIADAAGYRIITKSAQRSPYVAIEGTTWEAYESGLRRKFRSELRRRRRRLEEKGQLALEIYDGTERLEELLEEGLRTEGSGWKDAEGTSINARPAARRFYTEVAHWAAERDMLRLAFLRLNGQVLAFDYCLEYNKTHYLLKTGYDPAYAKFAPGMVMRYLMMARAFSEGLATYDFLGVLDAWKQEWTGVHVELQLVHMFAPTPLGFLDRATFMGVRWTSKLAKRLAGSEILPEHKRRLLEQVPIRWQRMLDRRRTR